MASAAALLAASGALSTSANTDLDRGLVVGGFTAGIAAFGYWLATTEQ